MKELDLWKLQLQSFEKIFGSYLLPRQSTLRPDNDNTPEKTEGGNDDTNQK